MLSVNSCKEDFLEVDYTDILPPDYMVTSDEEAENGILGCYKMMLPSSEDDGWGLKPNLFFGCHPTMDTQATGWDVAWISQSWNSDSKELGQGWNHAYVAIGRCNDFIYQLEHADQLSAEAKKNLLAEAKALRGFFFHWLAQAFGRVPILEAGENYIDTPAKAKAESDEVMWDFIIKDLKAAADDLPWEPRNGEYGRATKGMALTYLADSYMWKAYRCNKPELYKEAKAIYEEIINSGTYELQHSFSTLYEPTTTYWNKETIWAEILNERDSYDGIYGSFMHMKWFTGAKASGGWGTLFLSWEWYLCYEKGDKRRDASACVGAVPQLKTDFPDAVSDYCYGCNPFLNYQPLGKEELSTHYQYAEESGWAPSVWTLKYWREPLSWSCNQPHVPIYYMRYANVLLNYAECCFRTEDAATGWKYLDIIRNRAWGNLEDDCRDEDYIKPYNAMNAKAGIDPMDAYPIPFGSRGTAEPAEEFYTKYAKDNGFGNAFQSEVWKVAVGTEYRKEFNAEWCLAPALIRLGFLEDHINTNYPKNMNPNGDPDIWNTQRSFDFNPAKMIMPIPHDEIVRNSLLEQNEAYK